MSFSIVILAGSEIISALCLPQSFLRDAGITLLVVVGVSFLFPPLSTLRERPFARVRTQPPSGEAGGFLVGLALGLVFVPCAGPILSAVTVAGAKHTVGWTAVFLTVAFGFGVAVPLLVVALGGGELAKRTTMLRRHAPRVRQVSGAIVLVMALTIGPEYILRAAKGPARLHHGRPNRGCGARVWPIWPNAVPPRSASSTVAGLQTSRASAHGSTPPVDAS
jgi:cytochrome c biogenesis protein CcdA